MYGTINKYNLKINLMIKFVKMYLIKKTEIKIMSFGKGSFSI